MKKIFSILFVLMFVLSACAFAETASPAEPLKEGEMYFHGYKNSNTGYYVGVPAEWALIGMDSTGANLDHAYEVMGYSEVNVLFARGPQLYEYAQSEGIRVTRDADKTYGLNFAEDGTPANGESAKEVNLVFRHDGRTKKTSMIYNEELGKYHYTQYGQGSTKGNEDYFENVFVILAKVSNKGVYHVADLDGSGEGYYACGGKLIKIQWHHENPTDPFTFTLEDGTPLVQGIGNSYIGICPLKSTVEWE